MKSKRSYYLSGLVAAGGLMMPAMALSESITVSGESGASQSAVVRGVYQAMPAGNQFVAPSAEELKALNTLRPLPMGDAAFKANVLKPTFVAVDPPLKSCDLGGS